ncbi:hypothetical protein EB796_012933 [Bugula neritina]|uniref:Uncharacterized protein n=1 Tax=Bugula neritina TaxID=10212 RepID=A0A7J7JSW7_BUGNE|nr:hypothetical protein EB796_012933 [Bugula neritina]
MQSGHDAFEPEVPFGVRIAHRLWVQSSAYNQRYTYACGWVDDEQDGKVTDSLWVIKNKHGAGTYDCHLKEEKRW